MKHYLRILLAVLLCTVLATTLLACNDAGGGIGGAIGGIVGGDSDSTVAETETEVELGNPDVNTVQYSDGFITWGAVPGAAKYRIRINEEAEQTVTSPQYPYSGSNGAFSIQITALNKAGETSETISKSFHPLESVSNITVGNDGILRWDPVTGANAYDVEVDGEIKHVSTTEYQVTDAGEHTIRVRPAVEGDSIYFASWSSPKFITVLGTISPDDIKFGDGTISWKYVSGAACYEVTVNGQVLTSDCTATQIPYNALNTDFEVTIKAIGNHNTTFDGVASEPKKFEFLDEVSGITINDGILTWNPVEGATGYQVKVGTMIYNVTECKFDKLTAGRALDVQIKAIASGESEFFSDWSETKTVSILIAPVIKWNNLELDGDKKQNVVWDTVPGAYGYTVRVTAPGAQQPEVFSYSEAQRYFEHDYLLTGDYIIEVKATAAPTADTVCDSVYSAPITVRRLAAPTFEVGPEAAITSTPDKLGDGFTVKFQGVLGASGYMLYRDNNLIRTSSSNAQTTFSDSTFVDPNSLEEHQYTYWIRSKGTDGLNNGVVTLSSLSSSALNFTITVLATPQDTDISGTTFSYGEVNGTYGYVISADRLRETEALSIDLADMEAGGFDLKVCAKGNGSNVLASNFTAPIRVFRLPAPTNVRIGSTTESEGRLIFNEVSHATGYNVRIGLEGEEIPANQLENLNSKISTQGTTFYVQSTANYFNESRTEYYMSSIYGATTTFVKLMAPTFGEQPFTNNQLVWNMEGSFTPSYEVYDGNGTLLGSATNGKSFDITNLEGGMSYVFQVRAVGDGKLYNNVQYIDSDLSESLSVYKLATPEVRLEDGKYVWDPVPSAISYAVYVDGELVQSEYNMAGTTFAFTPSFDRLKTYNVQILATGNGGIGNNKIIDSNKCVIETKTKQLITPTLSYRYSDSHYSSSGEIMVTVSEPVPYAKGYVFNIGGVSQTVTDGSLTASANTGSTGTFAVLVYALGGNFDEEGIYYINSQSAGSQSAVTILGAVSQNNITIDTYSQLSWTAVQRAVNYKVTVSINGDTRETTVNGNVTKLNLKTLFDGQTFENATIDVVLQALGNEGNIVSSAPITIQKFNQNIK